MITCTFENGGKVNLRHVVVDSIVVKDGQILLIKRSENVSEAGKFGLPGGYVDRDETADQAALRELKEETGYSGKVIKLFKVNDTPHRKGDDRQNIALIHTVEPGEQVGEPDPHEISEVKWFSLDNLPKEEEFAFDHYEIVQEYIKSLNR